MAIQKNLYTTADFEVFIALPEHTERRFELIGGEIVEKMPTLFHGHIVQLIAGYLFMFLLKNPIGWAAVEARYQIPDDLENARIPDLSFVLRQEGRILVEQGATPYMPDLAVEVQSPGQSEHLMLEKAQYYLSHGTMLVWLVYPKQQIVEVLSPSARQLLTIEDTLTGGELLPGLAIAVRDIFPTPGQ